MQLSEWRSANNYNWVQLSIVECNLWFFFSDIFYVNIIKLVCDICVLVSIPLLFVGIAQVSDHSLFPTGPIINHSILWKRKKHFPPYNHLPYFWDNFKDKRAVGAFFASMVITRQSRPKGDDEECRKFCSSIINFALRLSLFLLHNFLTFKNQKTNKSYFNCIWVQLSAVKCSWVQLSAIKCK